MFLVVNDVAVELHYRSLMMIIMIPSASTIINICTKIYVQTILPVIINIFVSMVKARTALYLMYCSASEVMNPFKVEILERISAKL
jgi:hypothetical protein